MRMQHKGSDTGLNDAEAKARLARFGPNTLEKRRTRTAVQIAIETVREPMVLLLAAAAALFLVFGDVAEGLFLSAGACLSVIISVAQQVRSERAVNALRSLAAPRAEVLREARNDRCPRPAISCSFRILRPHSAR